MRIDIDGLIEVSLELPTLLSIDDRKLRVKELELLIYVKSNSKIKAPSMKMSIEISSFHQNN
jgi:hypothetical protein